MAAEYCSSESFPFVFTDEAGNIVPGEENDEICIFPSSSCGISSCCEPRSFTTGSNYMFIAFALIFLPEIFVRKYFHQIYERDPSLLDNVQSNKRPTWLLRWPLSHLAWLYDWGVWVGVTVLIVTPTIMKPSIQEELNVSARTVLQSAEAFLVPYKEIFQFVEDIINIKINYALSSGDLHAANELVHLGIAGSIFTGLLASLIATVLGAIPPVLQALTNPGYQSDLELYPGCTIIEDAADSHNLILRYWMIEVWKFPGTQAAMVIAGFMYGAMEYNLAGWIMSLGWAILPLIWFTSLSKPIEKLILLAWAEFSVPYLIVALSIIYLVSPLGASIRDETGVRLSITKLCSSFCDLFRLKQVTKDAEKERQTATATAVENDGGPENASSAESHQEDSKSSAKDLVKEGLCIMCLDVCVQLAKTLAIYLALKADAATAYQLAALDSELPSYGIAYTTGMAFAFKIVGPIFLTMKEYEFFFKVARVYLACTFLMIPLIIGSTLPFLEGLALESGRNACEYLISTECAPFFTKVYGPNATGGAFTLYHTYAAFSFGTAAESVYIVVRAMILTMLDFEYVLKSTVVAMVFYVVALLLASLGNPFGKEAISLWVAMYVPQVVLSLLFIGRLHTLFRRLVKGEVKGALRDRFRRKILSRNQTAGQVPESEANE